ncbi:MAG TPA: TadE/TadG family type IV pilus assembly protein [Novosphingobium sp.]
MKMPAAPLFDDREASATLEFALVMPAMAVLLFGILQVGIAFLAVAGMRHGVESGARYAAIYPRPSDDAIVAAVSNSSYGLNPASISRPTLAHGSENGIAYVDVAMTYNLSLAYPFSSSLVIPLSYTRRAYQY